MFERQPMVFGALMLKVGVPHDALLLSEVSQVLFAILNIAQLELIVVSVTSATPIGWSAT